MHVTYIVCIQMEQLEMSARNFNELGKYVRLTDAKELAIYAYDTHVQIDSCRAHLIIGRYISKYILECGQLCQFSFFYTAHRPAIKIILIDMHRIDYSLS